MAVSMVTSSGGRKRISRSHSLSRLTSLNDSLVSLLFHLSASLVVTRVL